MGRGFAWLDTGTPDSLLEAAEFVRRLEKRQGVKMSCPEEVGYRQGLVDEAQLRRNAHQFGNSADGSYLNSLLG